MSSAPPVPVAPAPVAKTSWLKKVGHAIGVALGFVAKSAVPIASAVGTAISIIDPILAPEISVAENLVSRIAQQAIVTEATFTAVGQQSNGPAKLQAVVSSIGPEVDQWVANSFPGATTVSTDVKAGLVNAVVALLNSVDGNLSLTAPAPSTVSSTSSAAMGAASAAVAAVAAAKK